MKDFFSIFAHDSPRFVLTNVIARQSLVSVIGFRAIAFPPFFREEFSSFSSTHNSGICTSNKNDCRRLFRNISFFWFLFLPFSGIIRPRWVYMRGFLMSSNNVREEWLLKSRWFGKSRRKRIRKGKHALTNKSTALFIRCRRRGAASGSGRGWRKMQTSTSKTLIVHRNALRSTTSDAKKIF